MKKEVVVTGDGSKTIHMPELNESYHSTHGALQEAVHVFIKNGLELVEKPVINVFELGFGTGLNAILAYRFARENEVKLNYVGVEAYPVELDMLDELDYTSLLNSDEFTAFKQMHEVEWGQPLTIDENFSFEKIHAKVEEYESKRTDFDIIFFDAFGPRTQGELWKPDVLKRVGGLLKDDGVLTTYCAQGQFRRDLQSVGFEVTKVPGPPGKREMVVAFKR